MIKIYIADVSNLNIDEDVSKYLPDSRIEKIKKLQKEQDKKLSYGASLLIDKFVLNGDKNAYFLHSDGKPYTSNDVNFSVSHSGDYVAIAVSDKEVGIDIQKCNKRNFHRLAKFVFHENEVNLLNCADDKLETFFELWTKKEAFLKLIGTGFKRKATDIDLSQDIYIENEKKYYFSNRKFEDYYISVCYEEYNTDTEYSIVTLK